MELNEIKNMWNDHSANLEDRLKVNTNLLLNMNMENARFSIDKFVKIPAWGLGLGILTLIIMGSFILANSNNIELVVPAAIIDLLAFFQVIMSGYQLSMVLPLEDGGSLNYNQPIIKIQKNLERLKIVRVKYLAVTRFAYALLWLPVVLVLTKMFFGINLYNVLDAEWINSMMLLGLFSLAFGIWISFRVSDVRPKADFIKKIILNLSKNDITGKNLYGAINKLDDINRFQKEIM